MTTQFQNLGFFLEYLVNGKYVGSVIISEPDREEIGYYGRIDAIAEEDIVFKNKKRIKKGQSYYTRMYPLCGQKK
jgi:hypothetical protein